MSHSSVEPGVDSSQALQASRRRLFLWGAGAAAGLAGAGLAAWRLRVADAQADQPQALWDASFEGVGGETLQMASMRGRPLLLNFWATWCPPCVEELPMLNAFYRQQAPNGWQVLGLAIDQPSAVRKFLQRIPLEFPVGLAGLGGTDLGRSLGNLTGGLPFTVVLGGNGRVLHRKMGQITPQDLQLWAPLR